MTGRHNSWSVRWPAGHSWSHFVLGRNQTRMNAGAQLAFSPFLCSLGTQLGACAAHTQARPSRLSFNPLKTCYSHVQRHLLGDAKFSQGDGED